MPALTSSGRRAKSFSLHRSTGKAMARRHSQAQPSCWNRVLHGELAFFRFRFPFQKIIHTFLPSLYVFLAISRAIGLSRD
ncbi:unnamed protein product [Citrullus colocynthis]|uniref:Uncharacterized protein n=1 Tax=Citrullus colocynthis TaxID=252529 RepID=A0ABP0YEZ9_9ROSI